MHLLVLTQYYPPEIGAPQARLSELAKRFVDHGHRVTVLTAMPNYPTGKILEGFGGLIKKGRAEGVDVVRSFIYPTKRVDLLRRLLNYFSFVFSSLISGIFYVRNADFLLVESPPLFLGISAWVLSRLKNARMIFNVSDLWPESAVFLKVIPREGFSHKLGLHLEAFLYSKAGLITGQSKGILENIGERFPQVNTFHLSNGVDTRIFHPLISNAHAKEVISKTDTNFVVLYAGLHGIAQGLEDLLEVAQILQSEDCIQFVFIGDGPVKNHLVENAQSKGLNNVLFLDPRPHNEIPALLSSANLVLIPLKYPIPGAVPSKLYEAMASGRPLLFIGTGEPARIVLDHEAGMVVPPGNIDEIANAIRKIKNSPSLQNQQIENTRAAVESFYDRDLIASKFITRLEGELYP